MSGEIDGTLEALVAASGPDEARRIVLGSPEDARAGLVRGLYAHVLGLVRTSREAALPAAERLAAAGEGCAAEAGLVARGVAMALHANSRSAEAIPHYERAEAFYREAGEPLLEARVLRSLVDVRQMSGDAEGALADGARCRAVLADLGEEAGGLRAELESNVGNVHFRLDRFDEARECYERAVALFSAAGNELGAAFARTNLGNVETNAHRFVAARAHFESARAAFEEAGHAVFAADCGFGLAYLAFREGRFVEAIEGLEDAARRYADDGLKPSGPPLCDLDLAEVHLALGARYDAARLASRAAEAFEGLGMEYEASKARLYLGIALAGRDDRASEAALDRAARGFAGLGNETRAALVVLQRAHLDGVAPPTAAELERASEALARSGDDFLRRAGALEVARALHREGRSAEARARLGALAPERDGGDRASAFEAAFSVEVERAGAELAAGDEQAVEAHLRAAVAAIDDVYEGLARADARLAFLGSSSSAFVELAALLLERGDGPSVAEALSLVERGRERALYERSASAGERDPRVLALRRFVDAELSRAIERASHRTLAADESRSRHLRLADGASLTLSEALEELAARRRGSARGAPARRRRAPASEFRGDLARAAGALVLRLVRRGDEVRRVAQLPGEEPRVLPGAVDGADLDALSGSLAFQLGKLQLGPEYVERHRAMLARALESDLAALGERLFSDVDELDAAPGLPVLLVPHGALHGLPAHASLVGGAPLFAARDVSYARCAADVLAVPDRAPEGAPVVLVADSARGLARVRDEVDAIERAFAGRVTAVGASDLAARLASARPAAVHLAAHGAHRPDHPLFSGMTFGETVLATLDMEALPVEGSVVTLAGCETSRSSLGAGEELTGPARALLRAGAAAVVGSLALVEDGAAARFVGALYAALGEGATARAAYSAALRDALASEGGLAAAACWSLEGDPHARCG